MLNYRLNAAFYLPVLVMGLASKPLHSQDHSDSSVFTCDVISRARPGNGVAYSGLIKNSTYRFSAIIPPGLTAWGAGPGAPFHGFIIYLSREPSEASCIVFEISIRVELPGDPPRIPVDLSRDTTVRIGNKRGIQTLTRGLIGGITFENSNVNVEIPRADRVDDLSIMWITPANDKAKTKPIFDKFLSNLRLW